MEDKTDKQQADVTIQLTEEQREQVKRVTGKLATELKIGLTPKQEEELLRQR